MPVYNWAFNYEHHEDRWNPPHLISQIDNPKPPKRSWHQTPKDQEIQLEKSRRIIPATRDPHPIPEDTHVDIIMTHGPAWKHLDRCESGDFAGCPQLLQALERVRPQLHVFGHIHEGWGAERVTWPTTGIQSTTNPKWNISSDDPLGERRVVIGSLEWEDGIQTPMQKNVRERGYAFVDISSTSDTGALVLGEETLMVNPSIKDLQYKSEQAGWLVDMDLPLSA
jgi:hypothetical protein